MGTQGAGRKRNSNKERSTAEDDALNLIAREAEARLAAKRAARAEAREIRMRELERQQKEIFQVQKKYYGLNPKSDDRSDSKWGDIEQWMEDSERYSRPSQPHTLSDDDERMSVGSRGSARVDDRDYLEKQGSRAASALTAATLASLGGTSSRRASVETAITVDAETATREIKEIHELKDQIQDVESKYNQNLKEVKEALTEVEEKYRKAMVSNAQLDNEKNNLMYQVDTLKDSLIELEELLSESRREYEEKVKDFEREKHAHSVLQFQFNEMKETLKQSEELLNEIRQLRLKQESFAREISDLQETVEWKDKKIGALERQKEYTDAIRTERDELREEVVKLKDILKKHGIVLGPDLSLNGDTSETETDVATSGGDAAPQQAQASPTSPSEGNSMLGSSEETQLRSRGKEEVDQEQPGQVFEQGQMSHLSADRLSNADEASRPVHENDSCLSHGLQIALAVTTATDQMVLRSTVQENATSPVETDPQINSDLEETDAQIINNIEESSDDIIQTQPNKHKTNEEGHLTKTEPSVQTVKELRPQEDHEKSCQVDVHKSESAHQEVVKDSEPGQQVDVVDFDSCPQEDVQESESCSEPCPHGQGVKDPKSCLQVVKDFESNSHEEDINDSDLCRRVDAPKSEPCPEEDMHDSKSYPEADVQDFVDLQVPELCLQVNSDLLPQDGIQGLDSVPLVDVQDSQSCLQENRTDSTHVDSCPQLEDIKDSESFPQEDIKYPEPCPQVQVIKDAESSLQLDVKDYESHPLQGDRKDPESSESYPQKECTNDPESCLQVDINDSELHSQVLVAEDSEPGLQTVDPESNTEPQHETAEASSDEGDKNATKPAARKTANARGKKKKKKRRGKKKGGSLEEQNHQENVTAHASVQMAGVTEDLGKDESAAGCGNDGNAVECLPESVVQRVDASDPVDHTETSNDPTESTVEQTVNPNEPNVQHLDTGKVQIPQPEAPTETFSLTSPLVQTKTDHDGEESLDSADVREGCVQGSEPEPSHSGADLLLESCDKDSVLEETTTVDISGHGDTSSSGVVHSERETSSETTNYNKENLVAMLEVESHGETAHFEAPESQNPMSVMSPSEPAVGVIPDTYEDFENALEQKTLPNQEDKEPEAECEYRFSEQNQHVLENEQLFDLVKMENSLCDLDNGEIVLETQAEAIADKQTLPCEERADATSDTEVQTPESENTRCEVSLEKCAPAEEHEQRESSQGDREVPPLDTYRQDREEDVEDEDEKGQSFDFDDMDIDEAIEMETLENPQQKEVELGTEEVLFNELNTDRDSHAEEQKDREACTRDATPENPEQPGVDVAVEVLPDESSNNNNCNIEEPKDSEAGTYVATPDHILVEVESAPEHLGTVDNMNEQSHVKDNSESSNTGVPETTDIDHIPPEASPLVVEASVAVENRRDLSATLGNRETPLSGKDGKKNGKKGKSKGREDCKRFV
ncbi:leucine-rich repeat flightless-interacting protein 1 isoform X4 [Hippocampus comes]|uniref:leucine-rich repeat flightless-interacting protein 1 isoform X4 n=1 Tax=Hippocampus comes TaxID=109280 RepID=UPI00094E319B|nr:PREDICTED: leucine-rich repeat flightless-interacting protein 1-like isoform X4 [Hippocampus comes]